MNVDEMLEPVHRRWLLLSKALETAPLDEALRLAQSAEDFLGDGSGVDVVGAFDRLHQAVAIEPLQAGTAPEARLGGTMCAHDSPAPGENVSTRLSNGPQRKDPRQTLTPRESEILMHLVRGEANKAIARHLEITEATVKVHLKSLLRKISAANRTQAAIWAMNNGLANGALDQ